MKKILAGLLIIGSMAIATTVDAYQVCSTAMQVTFKNGTNIVLDLETGLEIF